MNRAVSIELELPKDWAQFRLPPALRARLDALLDRQDQKGKLTAADKKEAKALVELAEMLTLMKIRARRVSSGKSG